MILFKYGRWEKLRPEWILGYQQGTTWRTAGLYSIWNGKELCPSVPAPRQNQTRLATLTVQRQNPTECQAVTSVVGSVGSQIFPTKLQDTQGFHSWAGVSVDLFALRTLSTCNFRASSCYRPRKQGAGNPVMITFNRMAPLKPQSLMMIQHI